MNDLFQTKEKYDFIILDPPSFTKVQENLIPAMKGYIELNAKAMYSNQIQCYLHFLAHITLTTVTLARFWVKKFDRSKRKIQGDRIQQLLF